MFRREEEKEQEKRRRSDLSVQNVNVCFHVKERTSRVTTNSIMCRLNENKDFVAVNRLMLEDNVFAPALRRDIGEMYHWWDDRDKRAYRLLCCASCHPSGSCEDAIAAEVIGIGRRDDQTLNEIWIFTSRVGVLRWVRERQEYFRRVTKCDDDEEEEEEEKEEEEENGWYEEEEERRRREQHEGGHKGRLSFVNNDE